MIKATVKATKTDLKLSLRGHAGAAEVGQDIVCASASILAYTVAQIVKRMYENDMLSKPPTIVLKKGRADVTCTPKKDYYGYARQNYCFAQTGFELLAHNYPQYVNVEYLGSGMLN